MQIICNARARAQLAQSAERWAYNPTVKGSSPLWGVNFSLQNRISKSRKKSTNISNVSNSFE